MQEELNEILAGTGFASGEYGDSVICPCGDEIELDGSCPQGCESPVMELI